MIDPLLSLAYSMHTNRGVYALLLGSGVSRAAAIPTGWEIVLDLVTKLAKMQNEECGSDPAAWYQEKYGELPDYSRLIDAIAKTPEERQQLLSGYFEPTKTEREEGLKTPTDAHQAIARLVASGVVRIIITTNFDRLIERAIEEVGITPVVLSTPDAVDGALPLVHQRCCVIKLHGDYLDTRIKNTPVELSSYDLRIDTALDRVFDEFGLLVCGWSAQWDASLRSALERCKSRRFTAYWATRGELTGEAARLLQLRYGDSIPIKDADSFFQELDEKITAIGDLNEPHPLSAAVAAATTKRLLAEEKHLIRFHDLVNQETERAFTDIQSSFAPLLQSGGRQSKLATALQALGTQLSILRTLAIYSAYWGSAIHARIVSQIAPRLATDPRQGQGGVSLNDSLRAIPSVMVLYSMGLAALANRNYGMLAAILSPRVPSRRGNRQHYLTVLDWPELQEWIKEQDEWKQKYYPASEWLFSDCRAGLKPLIPNDWDYERLFDTFEVVRSLVYIDLEHNGIHTDETTEAWGPPGRFVWKYAGRGRDEDCLAQVKEDSAMAEGLAASGLFGGNADVFRRVADKFAPMVATFAAGKF